YAEPITLVAEPGQDVTEAVTQLAQIGIDTVRGVVRDLGQDATQTYELADLDGFVKRLSQPGAQLLDVRMPSERERVRLPGAVERFLPDLFPRGAPGDLAPGRPVLVACAPGRRAAIAAGFPAGRGYRPLVLPGAGVAEVAA